MNRSPQASLVPALPEFQPLTSEQIADPYPVLAKARHERPVFYSPQLGFWVISRFSDVDAIYADPVSFSNAVVLHSLTATPTQIREEFPNRQFPLPHQLVSTDPPAHSRLKNLMLPAFLPARVNARAQWIRQFALGLIDEIEPLGTVDLVSAYAARIPPAVVGNIVGARQEDSAKFAAWVDCIFALMGGINLAEAELIKAWRGVFAIEDYVRELIAARRMEPSDDLTSDLILARTDDDSPKMSDAEVLGSVFNIAAAGSDTTAVLIAQAVHLLLSHPDQWRAVCDDRTLIPNAIDEVMRYRSPVRGLMRRTTKNVSIHGIEIPQGSMLFIHLASAGRDETMFPDPNTFDIRRKNARRHLGFGARTHACVGANLARLEARIALECLIERLPGLTLTTARPTLKFKTNLVLPAMTELKVRWQG